MAEEDEDSNVFQIFEEFNVVSRSHVPLPLCPQIADVLQQPSSSTTPPGLVRRASLQLKRKLSLDQEEDTVSEDDLSDEYDDNEDANKTETGKRWTTNPPAAWKRRRAAEIPKEKPGPCGRAKFVYTEIDAYQLFIDDVIIRRVVVLMNYEINRRGVSNDPAHGETCEDEIRCLIGVLLFRGLNHDIKNRVKDIWYDEEVARNLYRASMSLHRFQFLIKSLSFHDHTTLRSDIVGDAYAKVRWLLDTFERNACLHYNHTEFVVLDETLRNYFAHECDLLFFLPDKPGQMGLFFYTLGDGIDRYFSRVQPKMKPSVSMSQKDAAQKTHDIVMDMTSEIHWTGRNLTADRGFSAIPTVLELYKRDVTYVGTIKKRMSGLPSAAKDFKDRDILSTKFFWKKDSPLMLASYYPKKNKPVLLVTTAHDQPTVDAGAKKKPECVLLYNEQRCGVDVVNRMIREYKSQPKSDDYRVAVFTFLLDLATINAQTVLKYNGVKRGRRQFMRNLIHQLTAPWHKHRFQLKHLKMDTVQALKDCLRLSSPEFDTVTPRQVKPPGIKARCFLCVQDIKNMHRGEERKKKNKNLNKHSWFCPQCRLAVCTKPIHRVFVFSVDMAFCKVCAAKVATR